MPAQIPDGFYVVSAGRSPSSSFTGDGGIYVAHPRTLQPMLSLTGLPTDLTRAGYTGNQLVGADSVLIHPSGDLLVGERGITGDTIEVHRLSLNGLSVVGHNPISVGVVPGSDGEIAQMVLLDANTLLVGCNFLSGAIGSSQPLQVASVDLVTGVITPLHSVTGMGALNALAHDAATGTTYVGAYIPGPPPTTAIYSFTTGSPLTLVVSLPSCLVSNLAWGDGGLWATFSQTPGGTPNLVRIDLGPLAVTPLVSGWNTINAICVEPATGQLGLCGNVTPSSQNGVHWLDLGSLAVTVVGSTLASGLPRGALTGIDMTPSPYRYGTASGAGLHAWTANSHPSALPLAGASWRFAVDWTGPTPLFSAAFFALGPTPTLPLPLPLPPLGIDLWLDPLSLLGSVPLVPNATSTQMEATLALPLLLSGTFYLQVVHVDTLLQFGASDALRATIL